MRKQGFYASKNSYRAWNEHDSRRLLELVEGLDSKPGQLYADSAYDTEPIRRRVESISVELNIPVNTRNGRKPRQYSIELYRKMRSAER
jgi:site-specific DNA-adenine methylase